MNLKLILDTSACSHIAFSPNRKQIEAHLDSEFRRVVSVQTFWELMDQIDGGDGTHFDNDKQVLRVAAGTNSNPTMLPIPIAHATQTVLNLPRPTVALGPDDLKEMYAVIMKAKTRDELYTGVLLDEATGETMGVDPHVLREQQQQEEEAHIERLQRGKQSRSTRASPAEWAFALAKQLNVLLKPEQASQLGHSLDAAYRFDCHIWKLVTTLNAKYNFEKHRNDWTDLQQTMYLCDPAIHLITADKGIIHKVLGSHQADRVIYLFDYMKQNDLML